MNLVELHPAKRWATLVGVVLNCDHDLRTVAAWAREAGMCETRLPLRCRVAGVTAKASLDFARLLRAAFWRDSRGGELTDYLDVADIRTIRGLVTRVGLSGDEPPTVLQYLNVQRVIRREALLEEVKRLLMPMGA